MKPIKSLTRQDEPVYMRKHIGVRPELTLYRGLKELSKKEQKSMNRISLEMIKEGVERRLQNC